MLTQTQLTQEQEDRIERLCVELETGHRIQGSAFLRKQHYSEHAWCCLGVACDLYDPTQWDARLHFLGFASSLPQAVQDAYGFSTDTGRFEFASLPLSLATRIKDHMAATSRKHSSDPVSLAECNDWRVPFPMIAEIIRARPRGLFAPRADTP